MVRRVRDTGIGCRGVELLDDASDAITLDGVCFGFFLKDESLEEVGDELGVDASKKAKSITVVIAGGSERWSVSCARKLLHAKNPQNPQGDCYHVLRHR